MFCCTAVASRQGGHDGGAGGAGCGVARAGQHHVGVHIVSVRGAALQSHPAKADTMAVLEVLAAESGEPSYGQLMAEAAANPSKEVPPLDSALAMVPHCLAKG